jgi:Family of unknown function (DUF6988)
MEAATIALLAKTEEVIKQAKNILARHRYPMDLRTLMVIGFIDQMIEHHEAMLLLMRGNKVGSTFTLARSVVEGMYRGLWINFCATDAQIEDFEREDELPVNMSEMARAIDEKYRAEGFFEDFRQRCWASLCSYTHTGLLQLGRRFTGENLQPAYNDKEMQEAVTSVTTCILLLVGKFLAVQNHDAESREAEGLVGTYGAVVRGA